MSLAEITIQDLNRFFLTQTPHRPSPTMMEALADLARCLEDMAEGRCEPPSVYLSSLDPGVGKTQTIVHFVQALMDSRVTRLHFRVTTLITCTQDVVQFLPRKTETR